MTALPTRKDEDFRYADLSTLATLWPVAVETIAVAAGESGNLALVLDGNEPVARELAIVLGEGAAFDLRIRVQPELVVVTLLAPVIDAHVRQRRQAAAEPDGVNGSVGRTHDLPPACFMFHRAILTKR